MKSEAGNSQNSSICRFMVETTCVRKIIFLPKTIKELQCWMLYKKGTEKDLEENSNLHIMDGLQAKRPAVV